jgi:hypothetical protein
MALTATTLASAKAKDDVVINLTSATGALPKWLALVDAEWMRITSNALTPVLGVVPGYNGSTAGPHGILAPVIFGAQSDFVNVGVVPKGVVTSQSFGVDGAITGPGGAGTVPVSDVSVVYLTKATAGAYTLAAAAKDQQNTILFISTTAAAHTITMAGNASATDVATFGGAVGNSCTLKAENTIWACVAQNGVTVA